MMTSAIVTAISLTACESVWSCIDVMAWMKDTPRPTTAATITIGNET